MNNTDYLWPGIAAVVLGILFPVWGLAEMSSIQGDLSDAFRSDLLNFGISDWFLLVIGLLSIYIYLSLRRILNDQLNFKSTDLPLIMMVGVCALFFIGSFVMDATIAFTATNNGSIGDTFLTAAIVFSVGCMIAFGLLDIVIAIILLVHLNRIPTLMKVFAVVTLIQGLFEITIVFSLATFIIFPIAMFILAVHFLSKPRTIEVI